MAVGFIGFWADELLGNPQGIVWDERSLRYGRNRSVLGVCLHIRSLKMLIV